MSKSLRDYRPYDVLYIDGMNLMNRSYYGMGDLSYHGHKTGMLYGVSRFVIDWRQRNPGIRIVMLWEGRDSWRKAAYPIYKAHRGESRTADESREFFDCVDRVKYALPAMGVEQVWAETYEADDVAYTLSQVDFRAGRHVLLSSGDWDWWELCEYGDILYQHSDILTHEELDVRFEKKFKAPPVPPDRLWMFKVLTGDPSDNVSGVPRFPRKLASRFCNLPNIGDGDFVHGLVLLGATAWAKKTADNYWIVERNVRLLRSSTVPLDDLEQVPAEYDKEGFMDVLLKSGMSLLYDRVRGDNG